QFLIPEQSPAEPQGIRRLQFLCKKPGVERFIKHKEVKMGDKGKKDKGKREYKKKGRQTLKEKRKKKKDDIKTVWKNDK
ncbi:MAG: hypothetical protein SV375_03555, partial [Thermodesulfobacteriota bacterium]|nr:hypothetical protein [Thermodesulfobacteriota bacterium]